MTKNNIRRIKEVEKVLSEINVPKITLFNRIAKEKKELKEMLKDKLFDHLKEKETSNGRDGNFDIFVEDLNKAVQTEDFINILEVAYFNGEMADDNNYNFYNEELDEYDYSDYAAKKSEGN